MSTPIPPPLRAAAGLAAAALDSARKVPQQLVGLPVLAISTALQASLKAQQAYAGLVARGDEVLGQLRGQPDDPPWARFDDDGPAPRSAFDAVTDADVEDLATEAALASEAELVAEAALAAELLEEAADAALAVELVEEAEAAALADAADRALDPDLEPDVLTVAETVEVEVEFLADPGLTEAEAGGADVAEVGLDPADLAGPAGADLDPGADLAADLAGVELAAVDLAGVDSAGVDPAGADLDSGRLADVVSITGDDRPEGSGTEPGADLPAAGAALTADAAATGAALAAEIAAPAADGTVPPGDDLDGYLAVDPPVAGYDDLSIPQLRGRLRSLSVAQVEALVSYERAHRARPPYLTMLENRLTTLRSR